MLRSTVLPLRLLPDGLYTSASFAAITRNLTATVFITLKNRVKIQNGLMLFSPGTVVNNHICSLSGPSTSRLVNNLKTQHIVFDEYIILHIVAFVNKKIERMQVKFFKRYSDRLLVPTSPPLCFLGYFLHQTVRPKWNQF